MAFGGVVDGDKMTGEVEFGQMGSGSFEATRVNGGLETG